MPGEIAKDAGLTLQQELKWAIFECVDHFRVKLEARSKSMEKTLSTFAVVHPNNLVSASDAYRA